ncbi:hypothetical protein [Nocardia cyriacigeorgica]|uniref:hypothetical protein n=1 Tax=Nocardia cyriacigeorgica TaxID=135487 RepID=UPI00158B152E|nr:hypothetical protein [Nocardia cyriacigeorgica]
MRAFTGTRRAPTWLAGAAITAALALGPAAVASLAAAAPAHATGYVLADGAGAGDSVAGVGGGGAVGVSDTGFGDGGLGGFGDGGAGGGFGDGGIGGGFGDGGIGGGIGDGGTAGDSGFGGGAPDVGLPTDGLPDLGGNDSGTVTLPGTGETPHVPAPSDAGHPGTGQPAPTDPGQHHDSGLGWHADRWPFPDPGYPFSPFFPQSPTPEPRENADPPCAPWQQGAHCDDGTPSPAPHTPGHHGGLPFGLPLPSGSAGQL